MVSAPYGCPVEGCIEKYDKPDDLASHVAFNGGSGHAPESYAQAANWLISAGSVPNEEPLSRYYVEGSAPERGPLSDGSAEVEGPNDPDRHTSEQESDPESNPFYRMPELSRSEDIEKCPRCGDRMQPLSKGQVFEVEFRNGTRMATMDGTEGKCANCELIKDDSKKVEIA